MSAILSTNATAKKRGSAAEPTQRHLIIHHRISSLGRGSPEQRIAKGFYFLHAQELSDWLDLTTPHFPGSHPQELLKLALLPASIEGLIRLALCPRERQDANPHLCEAPIISALTPTSALCSIGSTWAPTGAPERTHARIEKAYGLLQAHMKSVFPELLLGPKNLPTESGEALESAFLSLHQARALGQELPLAPMPRKPRL